MGDVAELLPQRDRELLSRFPDDVDSEEIVRARGG
jgi:hypothetical protein